MLPCDAGPNCCRIGRQTLSAPFGSDATPHMARDTRDVQDGDPTKEELGLALERLALALSATGLGVWERDIASAPGDLVGHHVPAVRSHARAVLRRSRRRAGLRASRRPRRVPAGLHGGAAGRQQRLLRAGVPHRPAERRGALGASARPRAARPGRPGAVGAGRRPRHHRAQAGRGGQRAARLARLGRRRRHRRHDARRHHPVLEPGSRAPVRLSGRRDDRPVGAHALSRGRRRRVRRRSTRACAPASTFATKACAMRRDGTPRARVGGGDAGAGQERRRRRRLGHRARHHRAQAHRAAAGRHAGAADADQQPAQDGAGGRRHGHLRGRHRARPDHLVRRDLRPGRRRAHGPSTLSTADIERFIHPDDLASDARAQGRSIRQRRRLRERVPHHSSGRRGALDLRARPGLAEPATSRPGRTA